ncbi:hypothetical protein D3C72_2202540 [compost metagenome]
MLACAGVSPHPRYPLDGVDLRPLFAAPGADLDRDLYWRMSHRHQRALRSGRWKYLAVDQHEYLFDLSADERERANLAARYPDRLADLRARWLAWASQMPGIPEDARVTLVFDDSTIPRPTH